MGMLMALTSLALPATYASENSPAAPVAVGRLKVYVEDASSGENLVGKVIVFDGKGAVIAKGKTGSSGAYAVQLRQGIYKVQVTAETYQRTEVRVQVVASQSTDIVVGLRK